MSIFVVFMESQGVSIFVFFYGIPRGVSIFVVVFKNRFMGSYFQLCLFVIIL